MHNIYLILENGKVFEGGAFGAYDEVTGEIVFTTGVAGYLETLTDPSYYGQMVVQTFPLIGNYGVIPADFESDTPALKAYIVREWCQEPSNFRSEGTLDTFLKAHGIVGLCGVDTRELTKIIREHGVMGARIVHSLDHLSDEIELVKQYRIEDAVAAVSCKEITCEQPLQCINKVALWDFGAKANIKRELLKRGCEVICVPYNTSAEEILSYQPDGIMLSNGPGDPAENISVIHEIKHLCKASIPIFGICLGHQLLALAQGASTRKMKYGHRGANQPVKYIKTGKVYISSQNHGYAVRAESLPQHAHESFVNANDGSCEGVEYDNMPAFSVQFHPEACAGPQDTAFLFDRFIEVMNMNKGAAKQ